ncbi:MAG: hypothetical protein ACXADW_16565 [Candidatus Hodarchaeales archaeon]
MNKKNDPPLPISMIEMINLRKGEPVQIPPHFVNELMKDIGETSALIVLTSANFLRIIPTTTEKIVQIVIHMTNLSTNLDHDGMCVVCDNIRHFLDQEKLNVLHSDVLGGLQSPCEYCLYVDPTSWKYSLEDFKLRIERIEGVLDVKISFVSLSTTE